MGKKKNEEHELSSDISSGLNFFQEMVKASGNELATIADDGDLVGDIHDWISTGSYILNAQLSGSLYGGVPGNRIAIFGGASATGKTYYMLAIVKNFLLQHPNSFIVWFDSEAALDKDLLDKFGIDKSRVAVVPIRSIEEFRTQSIRMLDKAIENKKSKNPHRFMFVLDSIGALTTEASIKNAIENKNTRDMSKVSLIKQAFQLLTLKLAAVNAPFLASNWTMKDFMANPLYPPTIMLGGEAIRYVASSVIFLSGSKKKSKAKVDKSKAKVDTPKESKKESKVPESVDGIIVKCKLDKARKTKPHTTVETLIDFSTGLHPYWGLVEFGIKTGVFKDEGGRVLLPDGSKVFESVIYKDAERYFTPEVMLSLEEACHKTFPFGTQSDVLVELEEGEEGGTEF